MATERLPWISEDPASLRLFELAQKVAAAPTTLLISGESGTGKDYLARLVHELGPRRDAPFLKIDCASLPPQLVESELFGHERGAFTGAVDRKLGRFELGGSGTIVLDEVAALLSAALFRRNVSVSRFIAIVSCPASNSAKPPACSLCARSAASFSAMLSVS